MTLVASAGGEGGTAAAGEQLEALIKARGNLRRHRRVFGGGYFDGQGDAVQAAARSAARWKRSQIVA